MIETLLGSNVQGSLKITIIGAGAAGLLVAYRLKKAGLNVHLLEATSRVGGRLFSDASLGVEWGAWNLARGGNHQLIKSLTLELGLTLSEKKRSYRPWFFENGRLTDLSGRFQSALGNDPERARVQLKKIISLSDTAQDVFDVFYCDNPLLRKACEVTIACFHGTPASELSAYYYSDDLMQLCFGGVSSTYKYESAGGQTFLSIEGGNDLLSKKLALNLESSLTFNKPVVSIHKKGSFGKIVLMCKDGSYYETDALVFAVPASAYNDIRIEEGLVPAAQLAAIRKLKKGSVSKVLLPAAHNWLEGFIIGDEYVGLMNPNDPYLSCWMRHYEEKYCLEKLRELSPALNWPAPTNCIKIGPDDAKAAHSIKKYPRNAVLILDWPSFPHINGSYTGFKPEHELYKKPSFIEGIAVNSLFQPAGSIYFAGEYAAVTAGLSSLGGALESAEIVTALIKHSLLYDYNPASYFQINRS